MWHRSSHWRRADATRDSTQWLDTVIAAVKIPVGVGTFGAADAVVAVRGGAALVAIGHPVISGADPLAALTEYVRQVRGARG